jgi:hypothetical protein
LYSTKGANVELKVEECNTIIRGPAGCVEIATKLVEDLLKVGWCRLAPV